MANSWIPSKHFKYPYHAVAFWIGLVLHFLGISVSVIERVVFPLVIKLDPWLLKPIYSKLISKALKPQKYLVGYTGLSAFEQWLGKRGTDITVERERVEGLTFWESEVVKKDVTVGYFLNGSKQALFWRGYELENFSRDDILPKGVLIFHHGICSYSGSDGYDYLAQAMRSNGYVTYFMDARGHGHSRGIGNKHLIEDMDSTVSDFESFFDYIVAHVKEKYGLGVPKIFVCGESWGGGHALLLGLRLFEKESAYFGGAIMLSPLLQLKTRPAPILCFLCFILSRVFPSWSPFFGADSAWDHPVYPAFSEKFMKVVRNHSLRGEMAPVRLGTGWELLKALDYTRENMRLVKFPFLAIGSQNDQTTSSEGIVELYDQCQTRAENKRMKILDSSLHCLVDEVDTRDDTVESISDFLDLQVK